VIARGAAAIVDASAFNCRARTGNRECAAFDETPHREDAMTVSMTLPAPPKLYNDIQSEARRTEPR
jgi:hypothetical protein